MSRLKRRRKVERLNISWGGRGEGLILELRRESFYIYSYNLKVSGYTDRLVFEDGNFKVRIGRSKLTSMAYVSYSNIKPLPLGVGPPLKDAESNLGYKIHVTRLPFDQYLNLITPKDWKVEWLTLSSNLACIACRGRVYFEMLEEALNMYVV